jgi:hypothetical protein
LTGETEGTLKIGRKMLPPEGSHVCINYKQNNHTTQISGNSPFETPALRKNAERYEW